MTIKEIKKLNTISAKPGLYKNPSKSDSVRDYPVSGLAILNHFHG
jgi:hypothetical protein